MFFAAAKQNSVVEPKIWCSVWLLQKKSVTKRCIQREKRTPFYYFSYFAIEMNKKVHLYLTRYCSSVLPLKPYLPSGLFHPYELDESICYLRGVWCSFSFSI